MSERTDRILDILDAGLQRSDERGAGLVAPEGRCVRCIERETAEESDWCGPCRFYLLGDGPDARGRA